jgi:hypothetical protein
MAGFLRNASSIRIGPGAALIKINVATRRAA